MPTPLRLSYIAIVSESGSDGSQEWRHFGALLARFGHGDPGRPREYYRAELGSLTVRFERHTEFYRYTFSCSGPAAEAFSDVALARVPPDWLAGLTGSTLVAIHAALMPATEDAEPDAIAARYFDGNTPVGADIAEGAGMALTDFRVRDDGFMRVVLLNRDMTPRQSGRMMQRVVEIDTYRMLALMALPVARELTPFLARAEREVTEVTTLLAGATRADEPLLLERLTRLEAAIGSQEIGSDYRFRAAFAYYELVQRRIRELREVQRRGVQTFLEFIERRLSPAMATCRAVSSRQEALSSRVARVNQLLATRVDISRETQNQQLLESMNRRSAAQLRLQQTVEGLSIAAITYYVVSLIEHAARGLAESGVRLRPEVVAALCIPLVAVLVALSLRHVRRRMIGPAGGE